ncbi:hypothetical protein C8R43DRAFT_1124986 [Mycena crocata]|nr:hypothetical protein C8R43DRAFT_1124986 [Mycena crocata]
MMSSDSLTGECSAHDKFSDQECECTDYIESDDIPGYCSSCYHKQAFHLLSKPGASQKSSGVQSLLTGMFSRQDSSKGKASSSKAQSSSLLSVVAGSSKKIPSLTAAHREANRGMRPPTASASGSKTVTVKKGKGKERKRDEDIFKVVSVQVIPGGTEFVNGGLQIPKKYSRVPDRVETQKAEVDGLAVVNVEGFRFRRSASHEDIVDQLTELLQRPFDYFARIQEEAGLDEPAWCLATSLGKKLTIVPSIHPDGRVIDFNKGNATTGYRHNRIFIVSREPIPADLLKEWEGPESSSFRRPASVHDDESEVAGSASDEDNISEQIPAKNKRRLFSRSSDEEDNSEKPLKKKKAVITESSVKKWTRQLTALNNELDEIAKLDEEIGKLKDSEPIDLTESRPSTPDFLRAVPKSPPSFEDPPSPGRPEVFYDPTLGDPYDKNQTFVFEF